MGYPTDLLSNRSIVKHGKYALITPQGLVNNVIPGFENCSMSILGSPKMGASFVDYIVTMHKGGKNSQGFGYEGVETFVYCLEGKIKARAKGESFDLEEGGYLYCPPSEKMYLENLADGDSRCFLYKQKYRPLDGHEPHIVSGNANDNEGYDYEGMVNVNLKDLLPTDDLGFDMNFHILTFDPGASHGYIETHVQEHGAYLLSGQGMYNLDNDWVPVKKGDYIFMGPYCLQACYAVGREKMSYVYSKDCNRDPLL
ncbi:(S)-ureidoglycine aminohydrolase [Scopulibacillus darangshiensis]|uniref:(S)-ureidoglycine aminohydrolase n=1 Tax=Scopulibacillus darangshiensis TaxID=442528 RepID=A0A4R2NJX5_9BACL|nr:(S)-ureidoglycine aminohydrolase [Scopulibacillus darangshiensis]TCP21662.1 (S)-ureidoglycine aminohydrolase [Scopulibacillus darangshiensis]